MCAMLSAVVALFTRPTYSSISFGLFPAASMRVGRSMCFGMRALYRIAAAGGNVEGGRDRRSAVSGLS
jgi:hypothetical protein